MNKDWMIDIENNSPLVLKTSGSAEFMLFVKAELKYYFKYFKF